jgi:hypothetical protein
VTPRLATRSAANCSRDAWRAAAGKARSSPSNVNSHGSSDDREFGRQLMPLQEAEDKGSHVDRRSYFEGPVLNRHRLGSCGSGSPSVLLAGPLKAAQHLLRLIFERCRLRLWRQKGRKSATSPTTLTANVINLAAAIASTSGSGRSATAHRRPSAWPAGVGMLVASESRRRERPLCGSRFSEALAHPGARCVCQRPHR